MAENDASTEDAPASGGVQSVRRAASLLRALTSTPATGARLTDLADALALDRATVHWLMQTLAEDRLVEQDPSTRRYHLGLDFFALAAAASNRYDIQEIASAAVARLAESLGDSVFFSLRSHGDAICIEANKGTFPVRILAMDTGARTPLGAGATGIAPLAPLPDDEINEILRVNARPHRRRHARRDPRRRARDRGLSRTQGCPCCGLNGSRCPTAPSRRSMAWTWSSAKASAWRCSAPTAPARPRCCAPSRAWCGRPPARSRSKAARSARWPPTCAPAPASPTLRNAAASSRASPCWRTSKWPPPPRAACAPGSATTSTASTPCSPASPNAVPRGVGRSPAASSRCSAIGRALMARPRVLLLDEPSLGLAPLIAEEVYARLADLARTRMTILLVEQNTAMALSVASRAYVLEHGAVVLDGPSDVLMDHPRVREAYLGA